MVIKVGSKISALLLVLATWVLGQYPVDGKSMSGYGQSNRTSPGIIQEIAAESLIYSVLDVESRSNASTLLCPRPLSTQRHQLYQPGHAANTGMLEAWSSSSTALTNEGMLVHVIAARILFLPRAGVGSCRAGCCLRGTCDYWAGLTRSI